MVGRLAAVVLAVGLCAVTAGFDATSASRPAARPLAAALPGVGLALLLAGGLLYTAGVVFFVWERRPYSHMVWHMFVLGGSACYFLAVLWYAVPATPGTL